MCGSPDEELVEAAERALVRAGLPGADAAARALPEAPASARHRLARVLSRLAVDHPEALRPKLLSLLTDREPRVQRAAITGLGKIGGDAVEAALVACWPEAALPERRALVEALGKIGSATSQAFLAAHPSDDAELERRRSRALVMLGRSVGRPELELDIDQPLLQSVTVALSCRHGLAPVLAEEARARGLPNLVERSTGELALSWSGPLRPLLELRTALELGIEVPLEPADSFEQSVVAALLSQSPLLAALGNGVPRFRLAWLRGGHQRARTFRIAESLDPKLLLNDPRGALWEALVDEGGHRLLLIARPDTELRFGYRGRDVPAASHPTLAAALARVAGVRPDDVVWDPFVGSGLELCERGLLGPFRRLVGSDVSESALGAARENLRRAGFAAELVRADARHHRVAGASLIITNPPMGRRVARDGELEALVEGFLDNAVSGLEPGGRLVWLSPLPAASARQLAARGLEVERRGAVDLGGFDAELQLAWVPRAAGQGRVRR